MNELLNLLANKIKVIATNLGLIKDYVKITGTKTTSDTRWQWREWNNGYVELWMRHQSSISPYTSSMVSNLVPYGFMKDFTLPFALVLEGLEGYQKFATVQQGSGLTVVSSGGLGDTKTTVRLHWASSQGGTEQCRVQIYIRGKRA